MAEQKRSMGVDLIHSSIRSNLLRFAFPLFLGQLFQQLYNMVDALVVGNYVGQEALAAVTSTGSLIFLLVGFFGGVFGGVSVVIARCFGAGDEERLKRAVGTAVATALISGAVLTAVGVLFTPVLLRLMGTPDNVIHDGVAYLRIYFGGILTVVLYNSANGIFQAVGDSKRPLYYLICSSLANVVLDILLVGVCRMGVSGAALATVLAQGLSCVLAYRRLSRLQTAYRVSVKGICLDRAHLKEMIRIGLPSGVQNSVIAFANVIVQSSVNSFGAPAMAGNGAYIKLEGFAFIPINAFCSAVTTFVSQNIGAGQFDRVKKGARFAVGFACATAAAIGVLFFLFAPQLIRLFSDAPETIAAGAMRGRVCALFYALLAMSHGIAAVCRGAGYSKVPMYVMLGDWCIFRVIYIEVVLHAFHSIAWVYSAYPLTWTISAILFLVYYKKSRWLERIQEGQTPRGV